MRIVLHSKKVANMMYVKFFSLFLRFCIEKACVPLRKRRR